MNDKGLLYKCRRQMQKVAVVLLGSKAISKMYFRIVLGYSLNLINPQSFNEKLQWLKLNYCPKNKDVIMCADKYAVRGYIKQKGEERLLNDLLYVWKSSNEIDWEKLPNEFVLKCNHGCGYNIICRDKSKLSEKEVKLQLDKWMKEDFSKFNAEPHYARIDRRIICEKLLEGEVINYNIYCINGEPYFFSVAGGLGDGIGEHLTYYNLDGTMANFRNRSYPTHNNVLTDKLPEMIEIARKLSTDFPMVRVDLYDINGRVILSELTFTPGGALIPIEPVEEDYRIGEKLNISKIMKQ